MAVAIWLIFSEFMQTFLVIYWKSHIQQLGESNSTHLGLSGNLDPQMPEAGQSLVTFWVQWAMQYALFDWNALLSS